MEISFILVLMALCTVFQAWRGVRALWYMIFGEFRDIERYDCLHILTQILYLVVTSAGVYVLINLKGII